MRKRPPRGKLRRKGDLRRTKSAAQALLARFESSGIDVPLDLRRELTTSAASADSLNAAISKGLLLLQPSDRPEGTTDRQRALAERLDTGDRRITLEEWMSRQPPATDDRALLRVDGLLGELRGLGIDPSPFSARIAAWRPNLLSGKCSWPTASA